MSSLYDPSNWYWVVAGNTTSVYSSAVSDYVPATDSTYAAWVAGGNVPTPIDTEVSLAGVLEPLLIRPVAAGVLAAYQEAQAAAIAADPSFKTIFYLMKQVAALQGGPVPTAADALALMKATL